MFRSWEATSQATSRRRVSKGRRCRFTGEQSGRWAFPSWTTWTSSGSARRLRRRTVGSFCSPRRRSPWKAEPVRRLTPLPLTRPVLAPAAPAAEATKVRWKIAALLTGVTTLAFATRLSISVAAQHIQTEFGFSNIQIGSILSAFVVGYGICQIPVGMLVDRVGPRVLLTAAVFLWSVFTFLTPLAPKWGTSGTALTLF